MSGVVTAAVVVAGATFAAQKGQQKSAAKLQKKLGPSNALHFQLLQARASAAAKLEQMATKLEQGEPLSNSERTFLASVQQQADKGIEETRKDTLQNVLGTAAGTGFLRAGRTQDQARRTNIEAESSRNQARITREQDSLNRAFRRTVELPAQIRQGVLAGAGSQGQTFIPQISNQQIIGSSVAAGAGTFIGAKTQQQSSQNQTAALQQLLSQIGTGQGGTTAGGTSVQQNNQQAAAFQDLLLELQRQGQTVA